MKQSIAKFAQAGIQGLETVTGGKGCAKGKSNKSNKSNKNNKSNKSGKGGSCFC